MFRTKDFSLETKDGVAIITFDAESESVNTLSPQIGDQFEQLLTRVAGDSHAMAIVLISGKKDTFIAGAQIEFLQSLATEADAINASRRAQAGFDRLDAYEKPVVAAIDGAALGGGLEWALACDYRLVTDSPKTVLGFPEVQLGLLPGAGGTQRTPKLIGAQAALDLILTGRNLKPRKAVKLGLVDEMVPAAILLEIAIKRALELAAGTLKPDRSRGLGFRGIGKGKGLAEILRGLAEKETWAEFALEENPLGRKLLFDQARKQLLKKTRGHYPAPEKALEVVRTGLEDGTKAGLEAEAAGFAQMVVSDVSHRLVEIFIATTALKKDNGTVDSKIKPREVKKLGIVGGGLMGAGIAYVATAVANVSVRIKDKDDEGIARALFHIQSLYDERVARKALSWRDAARKMAMVSATTDYSGFKQADVVIEAVFEDLALKQQCVREVEKGGRPDLIFASNTSSLPITQIAEASQHPETVIGMHYFSPVNKMPLLEIVTHPKTADEVTATCVELGRKQGKTVIVVNDSVGFYTSRILAPYLNEVGWLLADGADLVDLDKALVDFGFPVGPITLLDEVGIDVASKVGKILHQAFGERLRVPPTTEQLVADGRLGRKAKKGFYTYDQKKKAIDPSVYALLPHGKDRKRLDRQEMAERCVLQFVNEAVRCLGEGVLRSPRDGDIGAVFGLGFPPFVGGPFRYADQQGIGRVLERTEHYQEKFGKRFEPAPLLAEYVKAKKKFYRT